MKQKFTFFTMIMILLETICLFIPGSFQSDNWHPEQKWYGTEWVSLPSNPINIFKIDRVGIEIGPGWWFTFVVVFIMLISFAAFLLAYLRPEHEFVKYAYYTPIISFVVLIGFTYYACEIAEMAPYLTRWEWKVGWLYYIIMILHILSIVFSVLMKYKKYENIQFSAHIKSSTINSIDELKKYKELLDMGAITQEEFEAKKKQLLGL